MKPLSLLALLALACQSAPLTNTASKEAPSKTPSNLEELVSHYQQQAGVNLTYDEKMADWLSSVELVPVGPEGSVLVLTSQVAAAPEFEVIRIQHAEASILSGAIEGLVQEARGDSAQPEIKIMTDPRTNSLLVMAPQEQMEHLKDLIALLDVEKTTGG